MKSDNQHIEYHELIVKLLSGSISEQERILLNNWRKQNPKNNKLFEEYAKTWELSNINKDIAEIDIEAEWNTLKNNITENVVSLNPKQNKKISSLQYFIRIAAVFIILAVSITSVYYFFNQGSQKDYLSVNGPNEVSLSDGSQISLNHNTELKYPKKFAKDKRLVILENGEAYFDVAHNKEKPFIINTGEIVIEVIGTSFNVSTLPESNEIVVIVNSGKVAVYRKNNENDKIILQSGEKGTFIKEEKRLEKTENVDENYKSWKTKKLVFKNKKLKSIVKTINKIYQSNIIINDEIKDCRYTSTFDNLSLDAILTILQSTFDLKIDKKEDAIEISGKAC